MGDLLLGRSTITHLIRKVSSILILLEVRKRFPEAFEYLEIFIDGGFERGSDILKAIALGATAVGIARPFLYSLVYGQKGVEHLSQSKSSEWCLYGSD